MQVYVEELTPEEIELCKNRSLLRLQLRGMCKAANDGKVLCTYCRQELSQSQMRLSHIIPPSQGGETDMQNVVLACPACCKAKDGRTLQEWAERLNDQLDGVHALITLQARKAEKTAA